MPDPFAIFVAAIKAMLFVGSAVLIAALIAIKLHSMGVL